VAYTRIWPGANKALYRGVRAEDAAIHAGRLKILRLPILLKNLGGRKAIASLNCSDTLEQQNCAQSTHERSLVAIVMLPKLLVGGEEDGSHATLE
jgi:hypothetical protein